MCAADGSNDLAPPAGLRRRGELLAPGVDGERRARGGDAVRGVRLRDLVAPIVFGIAVLAIWQVSIIVFNIHAPGAFAQVMRGEGAFTKIIEP